jgi:hypothetical protein
MFRSYYLLTDSLANPENCKKGDSRRDVQALGELMQELMMLMKKGLYLTICLKTQMIFFYVS